mmetsp:Transcript_69249/g.122515  ORF Transcript_69249/g.122515 Transcript_69249/m.122515 type:complete len:230 (+) Transcript_69249:102-791(+)
MAVYAGYQGHGTDHLVWDTSASVSDLSSESSMSHNGSARMRSLSLASGANARHIYFSSTTGTAVPVGPLRSRSQGAQAFADAKTPARPSRSPAAAVHKSRQVLPKGVAGDSVTSGGEADIELLGNEEESWASSSTKDEDSMCSPMRPSPKYQQKGISIPKFRRRGSAVKGETLRRQLKDLYKSNSALHTVWDSDREKNGDSAPDSDLSADSNKEPREPPPLRNPRLLSL